MSDLYAMGALKPELHQRLVADISNYALDAGIQSRWIAQPIGDAISPTEREYLKGFNRQAFGGVYGLMYTPDSLTGPVSDRFAAMAGCLVRNFVRARLMTLGEVLDRVSGKDMPDYSCILIPNFFVSAAEGGKLASWQVQALYDFLVGRQARGQQTIVFVSRWKELALEYGIAVSGHINDYFVAVE